MQEGRSAATRTSRCAALARSSASAARSRTSSFKFLQQAVDYEVQWQIDLIEDGGDVQQATALFDPTGETRAMRSKEDAQDYRPDPGPAAAGDRRRVGRARSRWMPELPQAMAGTPEAYGLPAHDASMMTQSRAFAAAISRLRRRQRQIGQTGRQLADGRGVAAAQRPGNSRSRPARSAPRRWPGTSSGVSTTRRSRTTARDRSSTRSGQARAIATSTR